MAEPEIILHHYPRSPFAEKVRVALGLKKIAWHSVIQPRMAPKPALTALTGGYRRIPVLQVGADIYCDTRCILHELERRYPVPPLYPTATRGLADVIAAWADRSLFADALGLVFGLHGDRFPPELHADRARFTAGKFEGWDSVKMKARLPELRRRTGLHLGWLEHGLGDGRGFLLGDAPSLADLATYHPLWYMRGNLGETAELNTYPRLMAWMARMDAIGHGTMQELSPQDALAIARDSSPKIVPQVSGIDRDLPRPGDRIAVTPDDWGFDPVEGEMISASHDTLTLQRNDPLIGAIAVHFPLQGFTVRSAE